MRRVLGCSEGRSADRWQDYSLFGHQVKQCLVRPCLQITRCHVPPPCILHSYAAGLACDPMEQAYAPAIWPPEPTVRRLLRM